MDPRLSTYTQTAAHPNKQYPTPPASATNYIIPLTPDAPPSYTANRSPITMGLGLIIPEKRWTNVTLQTTPISATTSLPKDGLIKPPTTIRTSKELISLSISRSRFILRLISTIFSMVIVGMMSESYAAFYATAGHRLIYAGLPIWPEEIDLTASNAMFAVGVATATFSIVVLLAGLWPKVRHVTTIGDMVAGLVAVVNFSLGMGGALFFMLYKGDYEGLRTWTCNHELIRHPQAEFGTMCAGMKFSFAMGWGIAAVEALVMANVLLGCVLVTRGEGKLGRSIKGSFRSRV